MTVDDIISLATALKGMPIQPIYGRTWLNDAKNQLAIRYDTACNLVSTTIACTDETLFYDLPDELLRINYIAASNGTKYDDDFYKTDHGQIKFDNKDTYTLFYLVETDSVIGNAGEIPQIHSLYHRAMAKHIASMELTDLKPSKADTLEAGFFTDCTLIDRKIKRPKRKPGVIPAPLFR